MNGNLIHSFCGVNWKNVEIQTEHGEQKHHRAHLQSQNRLSRLETSQKKNLKLTLETEHCCEDEQQAVPATELQITWISTMEDH
jgi:hypothetical protein